jgi:hypothetical protein
MLILQFLELPWYFGNFEIFKNVEIFGNYFSQRIFFMKENIECSKIFYLLK